MLKYKKTNRYFRQRAKIIPCETVGGYSYRWVEGTRMSAPKVKGIMPLPSPSGARGGWFITAKREDVGEYLPAQNGNLRNWCEIGTKKISFVVH